VLAQLAAAELDLADLHTEILGPLRIGALQSAIRGLVAPALAVLLARYPRLSPSLTDGEAVDLLPLLLSGDLDLVIAESWTNRPTRPPAGVRHVPLLTETAWLALSERHPLAAEEVVDLAALAGTSWTSCTAGIDDREALVATLRSCGVEPVVTCRASDYLTQLTLVAANVVAAMVPLLGLGDLPDGVRLLKTRPAMRRELYVAWRADAERPAIRAGLAALREAVPG
jgi:DNA-binding transcriptional LysR family regulator